MNPRFHVSNFSRIIVACMNLEMAGALYTFIRQQANNEIEVPPALFALTEQIEKQFFYMGALAVPSPSDVTGKIVESVPVVTE